MAYTKRHPIKATLEKSIKYIVDKKKTENGLLVYGLNCSINEKLAIKQMNYTKQFFGKEDKNLAFHFVQSFKSDEIQDYNLVHKIGIEWASRISEGDYQVIVATHTDKDHLHNHIILNSVSFKDGKKYNSCREELKRIRDISDSVCKEFNLSVIKTNEKGKSYKEWSENKKGTSWKGKIKEDIDNIICLDTVKSFKDFIDNLETKGYEVRYKNVKHISFKMKGQERATRGKTIGKDYTESAIKKRIEDKNYNINTVVRKSKSKFIDKRDLYKYKYRKASLVNNVALSILLIKTLLNKNNNNKIKIKNISTDNKLKQLEFTLNFLSKQKVKNVQGIKVEIKDTRNKIDKVKELILKLGKLNSNLEVMKSNIDIYIKYKSIYDEYNKKNRIMKIPFLNKYRKEINEFINSKLILNNANINTIEEMQGIITQLETNKDKLEQYKLKYNELEKNRTDLENVYNIIGSIGREKSNLKRSIEKNINKDKER